MSDQVIWLATVWHGSRYFPRVCAAYQSFIFLFIR